MDIYLIHFAALAVAHGVLIASGSAYVPEGGNLYNRFFCLTKAGLWPVYRISSICPGGTKVGVCEGEDVGAFDTASARYRCSPPPGRSATCPISSPGSARRKSCLRPLLLWGFTEAADGAAPRRDCIVISAGLCGGEELGLDSTSLPAAVYGPWTASRGKDGRMLAAPAGVPAAGRIDLTRTGDPCDLYASDDNPGFWDALWR
jgi:hypothetical protein